MAYPPSDLSLRGFVPLKIKKGKQKMNLPENLMFKLKSKMDLTAGILRGGDLRRYGEARNELIQDIIEVVAIAMLRQERDRVEAHAAKIREQYENLIATEGHAGKP
jgi:hypothetical protein